jgi:hypothetical protein
MQNSPDTKPSSKSDALVIAAKIFFALAFVPIAIMAYALIQKDALPQIAAQFSYLGWSSVGLGMIAGILQAIHEFKRLRKSADDRS